MKQIPEPKPVAARSRPNAKFIAAATPRISRPARQHQSFGSSNSQPRNPQSAERNYQRCPLEGNPKGCKRYFFKSRTVTPASPAALRRSSQRSNKRRGTFAKTGTRSSRWPAIVWRTELSKTGRSSSSCFEVNAPRSVGLPHGTRGFGLRPLGQGEEPAASRLQSRPGPVLAFPR